MRIFASAIMLCLLAASLAIVAQEVPPPPDPEVPPPVAPPPPSDAEDKFPEPVPQPPRGPIDNIGEQRQAALKKSRHRERVMAALEWLKDHQDIEGHWSADGFRKSSRRADAKTTGNVEFFKPGELDADFGWADTVDVGVTGLALMAFAAAGFDHRFGQNRQPMRAGLQYLRRVQHNDGCFGPKDDDLFVYNHAFATIAVAELYRTSGDAMLKPMVDRACDFILRAQNPGLGWRYGVQPGMNDTSVTGVMLAALKAAQAAGIEFDSETALKGAMAWFDKVTGDVNGRWKTGYDTPGGANARLRSANDYHSNATMDAIHGACRGLWSQPDERYTPNFVGRLARKDALPRWEHLHVDFYYWYWAATYARLEGGDLWKSWDTQASRVLKASQRGWHVDDLVAGLNSAEKLAEHGSWDPVGAWGTAGGRVYSTAMAALILQTEWRVTGKEME